MKTRFLVYGWILFVNTVFSQEHCFNGIDDDLDGLIDLNDTECICNNPTLVSLLPNSSFEEYIICPNFPSMLNSAVAWTQATEGTSDFFHNCSDFTLGAFENTPVANYPHGNGIAAGLFRDVWKEYLGVQLAAPLEAGTSYQLTFQIAAVTLDSNGFATPYNISMFERANVTLWGNPNTVSFPLNTLFSPNIVSPSWVDIGHVSYNPVAVWQEVTILFTPNANINTIMLGPPHTLPVSYDNPETIIGEVYPYFVYDNLVLNKAADFKVNIVANGSLCENNLVLQSNLTAIFPSGITYQWYKDGIALVGSTGQSLPIPFGLDKVGVYCVRITDATQCYISNELNVHATFSPPTITADQPDCINLQGSITVTSAASEYSFDGGFTWQTSPYSGPLDPSRYFIKIKSALGCISESVAIDLLQPELLSPPQYTTIQPSCPGPEGTGISITIDSPGSSFSFDDGITWSNVNAINNLNDAALYFIRYKDLNGCMSNRAQIYTMPQTIPNAPNNITVNQPTSCTNNVGTITVNNNAVSYSFDDGLTWGSNQISLPLPQGTYQVRIKPYNNSCASWPTAAVIGPPSDAPAAPEYSVIQPLNCALPFGVITITSAAHEYSFDDGLTWSINSASGNLPPGNYSIKVRDAASCASPAVTVSINQPLDFPPIPECVIIQPDCFNSTGQITVTTISNAYSIDNGVTWSNSNVFSNLPPGTRQVRIKNSLGCVSEVSNQYINPFTSTTSLPSAPSPQLFCVQLNPALSDVSISGQNIRWYESNSSVSPLNNNTTLTDGTVYYASQTITGCESLRIPVAINIQDTAAPLGGALQTFCSTQMPTLADMNVNGSNIIWYDAPTGGNTLIAATPLTNAGVYYASQNVAGCESTGRLQVSVTLINTLNANDYSEIICDDSNDGTELLDLGGYNANLISDISGCTFTYYSSQPGAANQITAEQLDISHSLTIGLNTIYVRIMSINGCYQIVKLNLELVQKPVIYIANVLPMCENSIISINPGDFDSYHWSTGSNAEALNVSEPGDYSLTVTQNYGSVICESTKAFTVVTSNAPTITNVSIEDWTISDNVIVVSANGLGDYEYSIDGEIYQSSNTFSGLQTGEYTIFVRDRNGCGIAQESTFLLMYPRFFTPNGDGVNDIWQIKFSNIEPNMEIEIYDRYGKFIKNFSGTGIGWDGTLNGQPLFADDYWFVVKRQSGKIYKGHFSLKR